MSAEGTRHRTEELEEALREAGAVVGSQRTLERVLELVRPGVYMKFEIEVSRKNDGEYAVYVSSATHGTKVRIRRFEGLRGGVPVEAAAEFAALRAALKKGELEGAESAEKGEPVTDPRCPGDWDE